MTTGRFADTAGRAVLDTLRAYGITTVFGIPGTHNLELYRPLDDLGIRAITARHEQGAGYAADGWSQQAGLPGVVITTSGPGLQSVMSAVGTAYCESRSLIVLSPGTPRDQQSTTGACSTRRRTSRGWWPPSPSGRGGSPPPRKLSTLCTMPSSCSALGGPDRCTSRFRSMIFCVAERATAVEQRLDLTVVCVDNGGYAEIKQNEIDRGIHPIGVDLLQPDWVALAKAFGAQATRVDATATDLEDLLRSAVAAEGVSLVHITQRH